MPERSRFNRFINSPKIFNTALLAVAVPSAYLFFDGNRDEDRAFSQERQRRDQIYSQVDSEIKPPVPEILEGAINVQETFMEEIGRKVRTNPKAIQSTVDTSITEVVEAFETTNQHDRNQELKALRLDEAGVKLNSLGDVKAKTWPNRTKIAGGSLGALVPTVVLLAYDYLLLQSYLDSRGAKKTQIKASQK